MLRNARLVHAHDVQQQPVAHVHNFRGRRGGYKLRKLDEHTLSDGCIPDSWLSTYLCDASDARIAAAPSGASFVANTSACTLPVPQDGRF
jgi:hypothetical protein